MKNYLYYNIIIVFLALSPTLTAAADVAFTPRVMVGIMNYQWEEGEGLSSNIDIKKPLSDNQPFLGGGATLSFGKLFVKGDFQKTIDEGQEPISGAENELFAPYSVRSIEANPRFHRQDWSVSVGYPIVDNFSVFAGYRKSEQSFELARTSDIDVLDDSDKSLSGKFTFAGHFDYQTEGPFVGVSYMRAFGNKLLSLNFAYASLEADLDSHYTLRRDGKPFPQNQAVPDSGNAAGMTFGVNWQAPIVEKLLYKISLSGSEYDFHIFEERVISLQAGLVLFF